MAAPESDKTEPTWRIPAELRNQLLAALSSPPAEGRRMTYEEFLEWADEDTLAEWVDGAVVMASPASLRHQDIINFLQHVLSEFVRFRDLGRVVDGPFQMKLADSGREPDLLFVAKEHLSRLRSTYLDGPADLAVEVVSPESASRDRGDKYYEYQAAGIPEYWLIDPQTERAEFYQLDVKGAYRAVPPDASGVYQSRVVTGFWLREAWLWQDPLPAVQDTVLQIGGEPYAHYLLDQIRQRGFLARDE